MKSNFAEIKVTIQNGDLENAGRQLLDFTQQYSTRFHNEVVGQLASLKQILADERKGTASAETIKLNKNRITYALLDLIDEIEEEQSHDRTSKLTDSFKNEKEFVFSGNVGQVIIQHSNSGDNIVEKKEKVIEIGNNAKITAPIVIADSIENSFNALARSNLNDETKILLEQLLKAISEVDKQSKPEHSETAKLMARDAEDLVKELTSAKPRRRWYQVSIEGLKQAAINIGEVAKPILEIVGKLSPLLLG